MGDISGADSRVHKRRFGFERGIEGILWKSKVLGQDALRGMRDPVVDLECCSITGVSDYIFATSGVKAINFDCFETAKRRAQDHHVPYLVEVAVIEAEQNLVFVIKT